MGGLLSEEFQAISDTGEDILVLCDSCDYASNIEVSQCVAATNVETDVKTGMVAPGTSGKFDITIKNNSEVNATYAYTFTVDNALGAKIQWSDDNSTWTNDIADLNVTATTLNMGSEATKKTIYWKWVYEENADQDASDTAVGFEAATSTSDDKSVVVNAKLTLTQVD